jgi:hypothetical protein
MEAITSYFSEILSFLSGAAAGSLVTVYFKNQRASGNGRVVDQSKARAGGDIIGGDKNVSPTNAKDK